VNSHLVTPKRHFGQNFLVNPAVKQKVFRAVDDLLEMYTGYDIIEVGPGQGDLTEYLITKGRNVVALEIDTEAQEVVKERFTDYPNFEVKLNDAMDELSKSTQSLFVGKKLLISNLPYNVGSRLLVDLAIYARHMPFLVILQNEVARKPLLQSDFTLFGGWIRLFWEYKYLFKISPGSFFPAPKVFSALVMGTPNVIVTTQTQRQIQLDTLKKLNANPNKTLANNLRNLGLDKSQIDLFYEQHKLDPKTRLSWQNYQQILHNVYEFTQSIS
jgi:16S rRNA (adenine1518-N6/adenine1519-N6)-dimethyltransferase